MTRLSSASPARQLTVLIGAVAVVAAGIFALSTRDGHAAESCAGLDTALQNNLNFIAGQKANPDAQSEARIANRQAVVDLIQQRRATAGCTGKVAAQPANKAGNAKKGNAGNNAGNANEGNANKGNAGNTPVTPTRATPTRATRATTPARSARSSARAPP